MMTPDLAYDICRRYVTDFGGELGEATCNKLLGALRARDLPTLTTATQIFDWHSPQSTSEQFRHLLQVEAFFKKNASFSDASRCDAAALATFLDSEKQCRITNKRLDFYYTQRDRLDQDLRSWMVKAESYINRVLGSFDVFLRDFPDRIRLTAGATSTRPRRSSQPPRKVRKRLVATRASAPYLQSLSQYWGYGKLKITVTDANRVQTVPKNWKTSRTIACEPEGVLPLQLAFDMFCKERLSLFGINLADQSLNQRLSLEGSLRGNLATVDLSCASDTVSYNIVAWLLPQPWFRYLCDIRSSRYEFTTSDKTLVGKYAKFSSMGNGATFALETLIFASACYAVGSKAFSVYGDDIIIETELVDDLYRLLGFMGFSPNRLKSFSTGPFRESCGTQWFAGRDVTPFYLRCESNYKSDLCHVINGLASICAPDGKLEELCLSLVEKWNLPLVPWNEDSTSGIWIDAHSAYTHKVVKLRKKNGRLSFKAYVRKGKRSQLVDSRALFLWYLQSRYGAFRHNRALPSQRCIILDRKAVYEISAGCNATQTSRTPTYEQSIVRKWVSWIIPAGSAPIHLYRWSDLLLASKPVTRQ